MNDGQTAVGDDLHFSLLAQPVELVGFSNGDPVVKFLTTHYLLTDTAGHGHFASLPFTTSGGPYTYCFGQGTDISTPSGSVKVECLEIGDLILDASGTSTPVKWVGTQTFRPWLSGARMQPVCISKGALGNGLPNRDLIVSADHGMIVDDYVINASALVNQTSIRFLQIAVLPDTYAYYHIETETHEVILANGAPAETFIDAAGRAAFDNYQEYLDLYGIERIIPEMDHPRISSQRLVPQSIKDRLGIASQCALIGVA